MHTRDVTIDSAAFENLGRTDKSKALTDHLFDPLRGTVCATVEPIENPRARYSVHFHRNGTNSDTPGAKVTRSVVAHDPGWGFVNHSSHVDFKDNFAYDVNGSAFATETGDETGSFVRNLSIRTHGSADIEDRGEGPASRRETMDFGHSGNGFWLQGPAVEMDGNVASGATGAGIILYSEGMIQPGLGRAHLGTGENPAPREHGICVQLAQQPDLRFGHRALGLLPPAISNTWGRRT